MWLFDQGCHAVNAMDCDSMHSALIDGYKEYSPQPLEVVCCSSLAEGLHD